MSLTARSIVGRDVTYSVAGQMAMLSSFVKISPVSGSKWLICSTSSPKNEMRYVGVRLVVVVVRDEVLHRVVRKELAELVAELGCQRLVVCDHERRSPDLLDRPGHRRRLARARRADQGLVAIAGLEAFGQRADGSRLVAGRAVGGGCFELGHFVQA